MLEGAAERRRVPFALKGRAPSSAQTGETEPRRESSLVPLILTNKENKTKIKTESVERSLLEIATDQQISGAIVRIGYESQPEGPFHIKVSKELATELIETGRIDIFEARETEEDHLLVEFEVHRADKLGRNLTLYEEQQAKADRHQALAAERREERGKEKASKTPSTLATVMWSYELLGYEEDPGTISTVVEQIESAMKLCQMDQEGKKRFTFNIVPVTKTALGNPDNKSLVYIDFADGDESVASEIKWPRAIKVPGTEIPSKLAFKRAFCQKHGLKSCCNQRVCERTTGGGVCKLRYAFKPVQLSLTPKGAQPSRFSSTRFEEKVARQAKKREREEQLAARNVAQAALRSSLAGIRKCRYHRAGRCAKVISGCPHDHEGIDAATIVCASATSGQPCKIGPGCPYRGHVEA